MTKPGYIRIINGIVKFEYHELKKPNLIDHKYYDGFLKAYEASKQTVEVSNITASYDKDGKIMEWFRALGVEGIGKNNQPCKAKVNGKAKIIELIQ